MLHSRYPELACSIARALEVVGERWSLLIIRDSLRGVTRFDDFQRSLGVARNVLTARLEHLTNEGVLSRKPYGPSGSRNEYELTAKGQELGTIVIAMMQWGDRHYPDDHGPHRVAKHVQCGGTVEVIAVCQKDGERVSGPQVQMVPATPRTSAPKD
jgi:DNA-binding HxlR family transcriptional regulator